MAKKQDKKSQKSSGGEHKYDTPQWKYLAFTALLSFPALLYAFDFILGAFKSHKAMSSLYEYVYIIATALAVLLLWFCFRSHFIDGARKYVVVIVLPILLFPSVQVYLCSPVVMNNKDIGTTFKLGSSSEEIKQYCGEYCLRKFTKSLYAFSLLSPRITLKVTHKEVVDLDLSTNSEKGGESIKSSRLYLIFSLRSVRGKVHSLSMITRVPSRSTKIKEALEKNKTLELTGKIVNIGPEFKILKANLEKKKVFVRPVVFQAYRIELNDDDES